MATRELTLNDHGKTIELAVGDQLLLRLPETPATGYQWAIEELDDTRLVLQTSEFERAAASGLGGGGIRCFYFQAQVSGRMELRLKHWREWEGDRSVGERFAVILQIQP